MDKTSIKQTVEMYMSKDYSYEIKEDNNEGGYIIFYPKLTGCVSLGETIEEAIQNGEKARREWFYATIENGGVIPEP